MPWWLGTWTCHHTYILLQTKSLKQIKPLLSLSATKVQILGDDRGAANVVKLAGNFLIASAIESVAEAFALVEQQGLDRHKAYTLFSETIFDCLIAKDVDNALQ